MEQRLSCLGPETPGAEVICADVVGQEHSLLANAIAFSVLHIIVFCLGRPGPNIAHLLLGFPLNASTAKDIENATLRHPHTEGTTPTCLHAVLHLVGQGVGNAAKPRLAETNPMFAELCFKVGVRKQEVFLG